MKKHVSIKLLVLGLITVLALLSLTGCGKSNTTTIKGDESGKDVKVTYSTEVKKSVEIPASYPQDKFPIFKGAYVMSVQSLDKSNVVVCFCKEPLKEVSEFYKDILKGAQIISSTVTADEYTVLGVKDGYTFTLGLTNNTEKDDSLKDYKTSLVINLTPAPDGMADSLKGMSGGSSVPKN